MKAVKFQRYGDVGVLEVVDVERPEPGEGEVRVSMRAAGINPGEAKIREGLLDAVFPTTFPSGQGSDLAGVVDAVGPGVSGVAVGDEVLGWSDARSSHAEQVVVPARQVVPKPAGLPWEVAGGLFVVGATAWAAVRAVAAGPGDTVLVSGAAGGVGALAVQLLRDLNAAVIGVAGEANHDWLRAKGVTPLAYGDGLADRVRAAAPEGVDAVIDTYGSGYVDLGVELGVAPKRIDTIADFTAPQRHPGVKLDGNAAGARPEVLAELAGKLASGDLELEIAATFPLDQVRDAYRALAGPHPRGKIVLLASTPSARVR